MTLSGCVCCEGILGLCLVNHDHNSSHAAKDVSAAFEELHSKSFVDDGQGVPSQNTTEGTGRLWQRAAFIKACVGMIS